MENQIEMKEKEKNKGKYLLIAVLILVAGVLAVTVSYIGTKVESKDVTPTGYTENTVLLSVPNNIKLDTLVLLFDIRGITFRVSK